MKLLIDTGSTKSLIDPEIANKFFPENIFYEPFFVSNTGYEHCAEITAFSKFNIHQILNFYLFNFFNVFISKDKTNSLFKRNIQ